MPMTYPPADVAIEAERVRLRDFAPADFEQAHEYSSDPRVSEYLGSPAS